jgi:hypothetical protein
MCKVRNDLRNCLRNRHLKRLQTAYPASGLGLLAFVEGKEGVAGYLAEAMTLAEQSRDLRAVSGRTPAKRPPEAQAVLSARTVALIAISPLAPGRGARGADEPDGAPPLLLWERQTCAEFPHPLGIARFARRTSPLESAHPILMR